MRSGSSRKINPPLDPEDWESFSPKQGSVNLKSNKRLAIAVLARSLKDLHDYRLGVSKISNIMPLLAWVRNAEQEQYEEGSLIFWANIAFDESKADYYICKFKTYYNTYFNS